MKIRFLTFVLSLVSGGLLMADHPTASSEHPTKAKSDPKTSATSEHPEANAEKSALYGVLFYADWCPLCKELEPKLEEVKADFQDAGITFVRLDSTDDETKAASAQKAEELGLEEIWEEYSGQTGFVLLVDGKKHQVVKKLTSDQSPYELRQAMKQALTTSPESEHLKKDEHPTKSEHPSEDEHSRGNEHPS